MYVHVVFLHALLSLLVVSSESGCHLGTCVQAKPSTSKGAAGGAQAGVCIITGFSSLLYSLLCL